MKEIKIDFSEFYAGVIYFAPSSYYKKNIIYLVNRNFKTTPTVGIPIKGCYLYLTDILDLKQFKVEILTDILDLKQFRMKII